MVVADRVIGIQEPRIQVVPVGKDHPRWPEIVEFVAATGVTLDPWQMKVLRESLKRNGDIWAAFTVAVCAPRQNGKDGILEARELVGARILGEKLQIHSAHLADTSKEHFRRLDDLIDANEWLSKEVRHIWRTNGHESIEFRDGCRIRFRTRTRGGGRGFSGSPAYFNEAMFLPEVSMGAILPVLSAQPDPQAWFMGSAVDQEIMDEGTAFARVRNRALKGDTDRLAYFEWSLAADKPDEVEEDVASDPASWAQTNPALGIRISPDYIEVERDELDPRTFAVERLGVGDWPPTDLKGKHVFDLEQWDRLLDAASTAEDPVCFSFDVSPSRATAAIGVSGRRADGFAHVEVVEHKAGTGWVVPRLAELVEKHDPAAVVCDKASPAASLLEELEEKGIEVHALSSGDHSRACGLIFDYVDQGQLRHLGTSNLRSAIKGAKTRPLGDAWAWARTKSTSDISPLVACTLALWASSAITKPEVFALTWA